MTMLLNKALQRSAPCARARASATLPSRRQHAWFRIEEARNRLKKSKAYNEPLYWIGPEYSVSR